MLLSIHVAAGGLVIALGAVALSAKKGGVIHRRGGTLFVGAMLIMAASAAILGNVFGGLMTAYFVVTARFALFIAAGSYFSIRERVAHGLHTSLPKGAARVN